MSDAKQSAMDFLGSHGFDPAGIDTDGLLNEFESEMDAGLAGRDSSLAMIPTFITVDRPVPADTPVIVVDAGGTNLRVATVTFDADGEATIGDFSKHKMPGMSHEVSKQEFFEEFAEYMMPVIEKSGNVGLCFSYATEISPDCDGKLLRWTKQIKAPEVVGEFIGANIHALLEEKGHSKKMTLLNDTIGTLLAGKSVGESRRYETYLGVILGTGTNTAYVEQNANITKRNDLDPGGSQAINIESGNFDKCPRSDFDVAFDASTRDPGEYMFEKMISGAYLGGLALEIVRTGARENLFSAETSGLIGSLTGLSTKTMDDSVHNPFAQEVFPGQALCERDMETIFHLFSAIVERAALFVAVNISAAILKSGGGTNALHPVCVNVDGSTYYKTKGLRCMVEAHLERILKPRGIHYDLIHVDNAPIIGAAVAGLTR